MSDLTIAYHLKADRPQDVEKELRHGKLAGLMFGPASGWLTFVPFAADPQFQEAGDPIDFAFVLHRRCGATVLCQINAADHGGTLVLVETAAPCKKLFFKFESEQDPDEGSLAAVEVLARHIVSPTSDARLHLESLAYGRERSIARVATALGLPICDWISPEYIQHDEASALSRGGRRVGRKPSEKKLRLPVPISVDLPQSNVSAEQFMRIARPFLTRFRPPWRLTKVICEGAMQLDGTNDFAGRWFAVLVNDERVKAIRVDLSTSKNQISFREWHYDAYCSATLEGSWIDSTAAAQSLSQLEHPQGLGPFSLSTARLSSAGKTPAWELSCRPTSSSAEFPGWTIYVGADSATVLKQVLYRRAGFVLYPALERSGADGPWLSLPPPEWAHV